MAMFSKKHGVQYSGHLLSHLMQNSPQHDQTWWVFLLHEGNMQENSWDQNLSLRHCIYGGVCQQSNGQGPSHVVLVVNNGPLEGIGWLLAMLCLSLWDFVHEKGETRYSGHLLSRLAVSGHNTTKQTWFPTTWRENWKSIQSRWL
jgi:hypothetical protein